MVSAANQNGTLYYEQKAFHKEFKTFTAKNQVKPFGAGSYYENEDFPQKPRHGTNTIFNADFIPLD